MKAIFSLWMVVAALLVVGTAAADDYEGSVRAGYIYTDLEGNQGVNQPTYNLHEGMALSLDKFRYDWTNGLRLNADLHNVTLDDRRLSLALTKTNLLGVTVRHTAYRRVFDFDVDIATDRLTTQANVWVKPVEAVKLFGGVGFTDKSGQGVTLSETDGISSPFDVDYLNQTIHAGAEYRQNRRLARVDYRTTDFTDDAGVAGDRTSRRLRLNGYTPLPGIENVVLSGGFSSYCQRAVDTDDTLQASTFWGAARYACERGMHAKYSFVFDRSRRTGDWSATDNIVHSIQVGKTWRGRGGVTVGYRYRMNDDIYDELSGSGYTLTGWARLIDRLTLRAGMNFDDESVDAGRTLTGAREESRHWMSLRYREQNWFARIKIENRERETELIGTSFDLLRFAGDVWFNCPELGELSASYAYSNGDYDNTDGAYEYREHVVSGEFTAREYMRTTLGFGGHYHRGLEDVDVEAFEVRLTGRYRVDKRIRCEVIYSAHNFDNLADTSIPYHEFYTANVVHFNVMYEL